MKRPERNIVDPKEIQKAYDLANMSDCRIAEVIQRFGIDNGYRVSESIAAGIRFGFLAGGENGKRRASEAHNRLHDYLGSNDKNAIPAERIEKAASWINDPDVLKNLATVLEGRAAELIAGTAFVKTAEPDTDHAEDETDVSDAQ